jgi:signal transduction histidine kinase
MTMHRWPRSLRWRLFAGIAATVAVSIVVTLLVGFVLTRRSLEREALGSLARQLDLIAAQRGEKPIAHRGAPDLGDFLATEQERLAILTPQQADLLLPAHSARAIRSAATATGSLELRGTRYLYAARRNGSEALVLLRSARKQSADRTPFLVGLGIAGGVGAALAALVAFALARAIARPVTRVAEASRRLARGQDPEAIRVSGADEVAALATSFNHLASELRRAQEAERDFLLSISHELKTPLTSIRGHAEALRDGVLEADRVGEVVEREAGRLERLIRDLLDLARLRHRSFSTRREVVDLGEVARETVERYFQHSRAFGVSLSAAVEDDALATGDADRVVQAISNLVENALRCTPRGGAVRELDRAFERFFLYDRHGADRAVGTGLGLAIVHELAVALEGTVRVHSVQGVGSTFSLLLPPATARPALAGQLSDARA